MSQEQETRELELERQREAELELAARVEREWYAAPVGEFRHGRVVHLGRRRLR